MATTVTYKGQVLVTVDNQTKVLETSGTWMEDDLTLTDSSGSGTITVVDVPDAHGGIEKRITAVDISDTTATAEDVASGEVFYTANGTRTVGTASGGGDVLNWQAGDTAGMGIRGKYVDINELVIDMDNKAQNIPVASYVAFKTPNAKIQFKNIASTTTGAQMNMGDFLRQAPCVSVVDFGGLAPASTVRWFAQWMYSQDGNFHSGTVTCTNLCLDNLSSNNDAFSGGVVSRYGTFDVYFTGQLKNTINLSGWRLLNADSINRLVECLYDYSSGDSHTLTLGSNLLPLVDSAHTAIASARNWVLE